MRRNGPMLSVVGLTDDELFDLAARSVAEAGARIRRLGNHRRTLDDIFSDDPTAAVSVPGPGNDPVPWEVER